MPTFQSAQLLEKLAEDIHYGITQTAQLSKLSNELLHTPAPNSQWSPAQHIHHLNFYANFYTGSIEKSMERASHNSARSKFRAGWLGDYFTRIIGPAPANEQLKVKIKSPANAIPPESVELDVAAQLNHYLKTQQQLLSLLKQAKHIDLGRNRVATSLSPWITLKLGDTFRFVVAHQQRHFQTLVPLLTI